MTEFLDQEFLEMSLANVSDLLLQKLCENQNVGKDYSCARLVGKGNDDGRLYEMTIIMRGVNDE